MLPKALFLLICFNPFLVFSQAGHRIAQAENVTAGIYDTCRTYLFYQSIGTNANQEKIEKACTVHDDGIISVGSQVTATGSKGLIIKQDRDGRLLWKKTISHPGYIYACTSFSQARNGELLVTGRARDLVTMQDAVLLCKFSATGNLLWQKAFNYTSSEGEMKTAKIYSVSDRECFFAAQYDSSIVYGYTDSLGNLSWQHSIRTDSSSKLVDVTGFDGNLYIMANATDSGYHVSNLYNISYYSGGNQLVGLTQKYGGRYLNTHYIMHDVGTDMNFSNFSGIRSVNGQPWEVIRLNMSFSMSFFALENLVTPGVVLDSTARTAISIYGDCLAFTSSNKSKDVHLARTTQSSTLPTHMLWSCSNTLADSIVMNSCFKTWDAGYNILGHTEQGTVCKIIQMKMDSASHVPACVNRVPRNFSMVINPAPANMPVIYSNIGALLYSNNDVGLITSVAADTLFLCRELNCPQVPAADTCMNSFHKIYQAYNPDNAPRQLTEINKNIYTFGNQYMMGYHQDFQQTFVAKVDPSGQILKQRSLTLGYGNVFCAMIKTKDSALILGGLMNDSIYAHRFYVAKMDTSFTMTWIKSFRIFDVSILYGGVNLTDIQEDANGNLYVVCMAVSLMHNDDRTVLVKLDPSGNLIWSCIYRTTDPGIPPILLAGKFATEGGYGYLTCYAGSSPNSYPVLLKINCADGSIVWNKKYTTPGFQPGLQQMVHIFNNEIFLYGYANSTTGGPSQNIIAKADVNGNILAVKSHFVPSSTGSPNFTYQQAPDGTINMASSAFPSPSSDAIDCNIKLNSNLAILSAFTRSQTLQKSVNIYQTADGSLFQAGSEFSHNFTNDYHLYTCMLKYAPDGSSGTCPAAILPVTESTLALNASSANIVKKDTVVGLDVPVYNLPQQYLAEAQLLCTPIQGCTDLDLTGSDTICDANLVYTYKAIKNNGCLAPIVWTTDAAQVQVIFSDNDSIRVKFLSQGDIKLKATMYSGCIALYDSIYVHVYATPPVLNLGPETSLCNSSSIILHAHSGYQSYIWQDGSIDSVFTVTTAGTYYVTVRDSCNEVFSDTVIVSPDLPVAFDIGTDTAKCNNDTITLHINTGFSNYVWTPLTNLIPVSAVTVNVFPANTMYYYVTAIKSNGCRLKDSIKITVNHSVPVQLGPDTALCRGDSLLLYAGAGFSSYTWSTGAVGASIYVHDVGAYYVMVTDANSCRSGDTIHITSLFDLPALHLSGDSAICSGQQKIIDAGPGFNSYLWNTGNTTQSITITSTGSYWVTVASVNGCRATDTVHINYIYPSPGDFLFFSDSSNCIYDTILIKTNTSFTNYLWNNGSTSPQLMVSAPGLYWLQVTDGNGCKGSDSVRVSARECPDLIFFPNAFTPNADGTNDVYRPGLFGTLKSYHIKIFNRWGMLLYEGFDPREGWNGMYKGASQETGVYVWDCSYMFKTKAEHKKGTLLLLR